MSRTTVAHPVVWTVLYLPFGAFSGFVSVAMTFFATKHGLSITQGATLNFFQMLSQWMKWAWAPAVDVTLTPKRWYLIGVSASAVSVWAMSSIPISAATLPLLLAVITIGSLLNSFVGMAIEAIMAQATPPDQQGRTSAWFQAGNLGGAGMGGGLGLNLLEWLPSPWMAGGILGLLFLCCAFALLAVPDTVHRSEGRVVQAVGRVFRDIGALVRTKGGLLAAFLCFLPLGTGAAQGVLAQAGVAAHWGAGAWEVSLVQGYSLSVLTALGCFAGGWLCDRLHPRVAYALIGLGLAAVATGMAVTPKIVALYLFWNVLYSFGVGLAYAAFTAVVLNAIGWRSAATKYNIFASLSNFPIWWLGFTLARFADVWDPDTMLLAEAGFAVLAVVAFWAFTQLVRRTSLPEHLVEEPAEAVPAR
jgi:MFS family permease